ncbi:MAG: acetylglutamate kinase [Clostridia bacterium]|nr:acetylglutamate kinase [Clostridia bacterium]
MKISNAIKAEVLTQALPYIQKYYNQIIVVKYGGNAMLSEELKKAVMGDVVLLAQIGVKVVLVHGGGPEINEALAKMNIESKFINGLRQTDKETVEVVQMVLAGKINKNLVNLIENTGGKAMGLCGVDGHMIEAAKISDELGYVGDIVSVNTKPIFDTLANGYIPVISSIGYDKQGNIYNINADMVAARIAGELKACSLISMTDIIGILRDPNDTASLIPEINVSYAPQLIKEGVITGGMIPKVYSCIEAIRRGVNRVFIINGTIPHAILIEVLSDEGIGTMFFN